MLPSQFINMGLRKSLSSVGSRKVNRRWVLIYCFSQPGLRTTKSALILFANKRTIQAVFAMGDCAPRTHRTSVRRAGAPNLHRVAIQEY